MTYISHLIYSHPVCYYITTAYYKSRLPANESITASFMSELVKLRDSYWDFSGAFRLDQSEIATLIDLVGTA